MNLSLAQLVDGLRTMMNRKCLNFNEDMDIAMEELTDFMDAVDELAYAHKELLRAAQQAGVDTFQHGDALDTFDRRARIVREALGREQPVRIENGMATGRF